MSENFDWRMALGLDPKGDFEHQDPQKGLAIRGPLKRMHINDDDEVVIELEWAASMPTLPNLGFGTWTEFPVTLFTFPNLVVPYIVEPTPEKGERIRFGLSFIYLTRIEGVNTLDRSQVQSSPA